MIHLDVWKEKLKFTVYIYFWIRHTDSTQDVTQIRHTTSTVALTSLRFLLMDVHFQWKIRVLTFFGKPEDNFEKY
jgi:hypothetical protein